MDYKKPTVAIIGAGPAGCICAYYAQKNCDVTLFDFAKPLHTLLYTGGGRCNLAYAEYDFRELAKFYPRGEKFLYSVFSKFATGDTLDFFEKIGVETYTQDDLRIFPTSNSADEVREKILNSIKSCKIKKEKVVDIYKKADETFSLKTDQNDYSFDKIVIAVGGHAGFALADGLGHRIIQPRPALVGLVTKESLKPIQGVSLKSISAEVFFENKKVAQVKDDLLFTHVGITGPLAYKISSLCARINYTDKNPLKVKLDFIQGELADGIDLQNLLNSNPKKDIKNLVSDFTPKSIAHYLLTSNNINLEEKCCNINAKMRDLILKSLKEFEINVVSPTKEGEVVTAGGVCLDEINPKTMESKLEEGLYFCGEVIDVDGFCGGFNLQNCWSTGFVVGENVGSEN